MGEQSRRGCVMEWAQCNQVKGLKPSGVRLPWVGGGKERSILPQAPSPIGRRLSPRGDTPTLLGCPCIDVDWAPSGSQAMALTEEFSRWLLCIKEYFFFNLHFLS